MDVVELNVVTAPKDAVFQARINKEIRATVENYCNDAGLTLTDAFNMMLQIIMTEKRIPWLSTPKNRLTEEKALMRLIDELETARKSIKMESYSHEELEKHFGV